jgi:hypothetical protein
MILSPNLSKRSLEKELMDALDCNEARLFKSFEQMALVNRLFSRSRFLLKRHLIPDMLRDPKREYHLLDLGAGGCDLPVWFLTHTKKMGLFLRITCMDMDARALRFAKQKYGHIPHLHFEESSASLLETKDFHADYIFANHFLHHLPQDSISPLLRAIHDQARRGFLLNDLRRSLFSYWAYTVFAGLFFHQSFTFHDGRLSICRGFLEKEMKLWIEAIGLKNQVHCSLHFPGRLALYAFRP